MRWGGVITVTLVAMSSLVGSVGVSAARAQEATPAADCPSTTLDENKALVEGYWNDVYNKKDPQAVIKYLAENYQRNNPSRPQPSAPGLDDDVAFVTENLKDYPDLQTTIDKIMAEGDMVTALVTWSGT